MGSKLVKLSEECPQCHGSGMASIVIQDTPDGGKRKVEMRKPGTPGYGPYCKVCGGLTVVSKRTKKEFEAVLSQPA